MNNQIIKNKSVISIIVGVIYFILNVKSNGPTYQQDEIGYLVNAAFLGGNVIDGYSSYHAGYSIFLTPIFLLFENPFEIWPAVVFINSLFWAGSFYISIKIIDIIYPQINPGKITFSLILSFAYSSWISITGYAFSQSCYVFIYMMTAYLLINGLIKKESYTSSFSLAVGFLYWVHPTAVGPIMASFLMVIVYGMIHKKWTDIAKHIAIVLAMIFVYKLGLQALMKSMMTPTEFVARAHYPSIGLVLESALSLKFWKDWLIIFIGQLSYLTIATFGIFAIAVVVILNWVFSLGKINEATSIDNVKTNFGMYVLASLVAVAAISGASFASQSHGPSVDEWFYGRYIESVLLPLFLIGSVEYKKTEMVKVLFLCSSIVAIGYLIYEVSGNFTWINLVNLQGFWPYLVFKQNLAVSFIIGAIAVAAVLYMGNRLILLPAVIIYSLAFNGNKEFHNNLYQAYSKPSSMVKFVRENFKPGQCVAFDEYLPKEHTNLMAERIRLYSFYLFDYKFSRFAINKWYENCNGPILSFKKVHDFGIQVKQIAYESNTGLGLYVKSEECKKNNSVCNAPERF